jgi:hypothetical protein
VQSEPRTDAFWATAKDAKTAKCDASAIHPPRIRDSAHFAVIVGDELANGDVQLKDLPAATQKVVHLDDLARELIRASASHRHGTDVGA